MLIVYIANKPKFFSLYADGIFCGKTFNMQSQCSEFMYTVGTVICLYYTYPHFREACLIRVNPAGITSLPSLSENVELVFRVHASKVDKVKRALAYLNVHAGGAFRFTNDFYLRLYYLILQRGKLNYVALAHLTQGVCDKE